MKGDLIAKLIIGILGISAVNLFLTKQFNYNIIDNFFPQYATEIYIGIGIIGVYVLYTTFKN